MLRNIAFFLFLLKIFGFGCLKRTGSYQINMIFILLFKVHVKTSLCYLLSILESMRRPEQSDEHRVQKIDCIYYILYYIIIYLRNIRRNHSMTHLLLIYIHSLAYSLLIFVIHIKKKKIFYI